MKAPTVPITKGELRISRDLDELSGEAADFLAQVAQSSAQEQGRFALALSGGSTPSSLYGLLAGPEFRDRIPWAKTHLFWSDERCVPPDHPASNYRLANEALLARVPVPGENVHRMAAELEPPRAAAEYERLLREFFALAQGELPRFDLVLLGMGEEGHTASLFPGSAALREKERLVAAPYVDRLNAYRLTFTLPVLNAAANVVFLVAGENKAAMLKQVLRGNGDSPPAALVHPFNGRLLWFVDQAAARLLA